MGILFFFNIMPSIVCTDLNECVLIWAHNASNENDVEYNVLYFKVTHTYIFLHIKEI
jgi:hypothetical protein